MRWDKVIVALLIVLALLQYWYWGTEHCDACSFNIHKFYSEYKDECLTEVEYVDGLPLIDLSPVEAKGYLNNVSSKNETTEI